MAVPASFFKNLKKALESCHNPIYFFDDDPDGLCAFMQAYKFIQEGHGIVVKTHPVLEPQFLRQVNEYQPDKIIVLDIPNINPEFIHMSKREIVWIDHHESDNPHLARYFNPRKHGEKKLCTSATIYKALKKDLWIAAIGSIADWTMPDFIKEFQKQYPDLLPKRIRTPEKALFESKAGEIARKLSFMLKASASEVLNSAKILTRIDDPRELVDGSTSRARYLLKKTEKISKEYNTLLERAKAQATRSRFLIFTYSQINNSLTNDLANELNYRYPKKITIVGREKSGEVKMSLRSQLHNLPPALQRSLQGLKGYGGGHEHACGACVDKDDFSQFIERLKKELV